MLTNQKVSAGAHFPIEPTCIIITLQKGSLDAHVKNVHTENKEEFKCEICNLNYSSKRVLKEHIELIHEMDNPNKCSICETKTSFTNKGRLTEHIRTVHEG